MPSRRFRSFTVEIRRKAAGTGSSEVGSSSMRNPGRIARAPAIATRCFWPGERSSMRREEKGSSPNASSAKPTLDEISSRGSPKFSGPNATSSSTRFMTSWSSGSWNTTATRRLTSHRFSSLTGTPSIWMSPSVGYKTAVSSLTSVLFPEPLCPMSATSCPGSTWRSRPLNAGTASASPVR